MSFAKSLALEYELYFNNNFNRYRRSVRKIDRGKYGADDWANDWAGMWLGALELAVRPYNFVLRGDDSKFSVKISLTDPEPTAYLLDVSVPGSAMDATATLKETVGNVKQFNVTATTVTKRNCLVLKIPPLSGPAMPAIVFIEGEEYKGKIIFGGSTKAAAKVRIRVVA